MIYNNNKPLYMLRFFQLLIIIYIILVIYNVLELHKYNKYGYVYHTNNTNEVMNILQQLTPILYHDEFVNDTFDEIIQKNMDYKHATSASSSFHINDMK